MIAVIPVPTENSHSQIASEAALMASLQTAPLAHPENLEALLGRFLDSIITLAGAQAGAVRVLDDDDASMRLVAHLGLPADVIQTEQRVDKNCGVCGQAATADVLSWVDDLSVCSHHGSQHFFGQQCKSMLAISLPYGSKILGIYNLFFNTKLPIRNETLTLLRLVGQLLGLSLHNARIERERLRVTVLKERQEMINEVHDVLAQTLAYARMRIPLLNDAILKKDEPHALKYLADLRTAVTEVHDNLREVMTYFRSRMDPLGLLHALHAIAESFHSKNAIELEIRNTVPHLNLTDEQEVQIFYVVQEALANIAKHSMARHAVVMICSTPQHLEFLIEDDGLGMDEPSVATIVTSAKPLVPSTHFGLDIMKSRAKRLGGSLEVGSKDGVGTRVRLQIPHHRTNELAS
ncbi:ATP-binding protein [Rhodoferax sp.]|uniref:GAF domain-containing sensor histidine kinase n=1 Tax=Rhodoferax sp. TaxID=50421 RepID=UPI002601CC00|nr:ATP-binding protein [Rhodoferax sp.]MDD2809646.1 ATP-binding protein [Rhodoferax sp.]MDD4943601.1 ATP-binding protein [Rhodoferax sp.]